MFIFISSVKLNKSLLKLSGLVQRSERLPDGIDFDSFSGCGFEVFFLVWWLVFLPSPAVLCHLGQGEDLAAFGICVPYPVYYWIVISYSPSVRGWIKMYLKLQRVSSLAVSTLLFYTY